MPKSQLDQFHRWQCNVYANNVRMDLLTWYRPLPDVNRSGRPRPPKRERREIEVSLNFDKLCSGATPRVAKPSGFHQAPKI